MIKIFKIENQRAGQDETLYLKTMRSPGPKNRSTVADSSISNDTPVRLTVEIGLVETQKGERTRKTKTDARGKLAKSKRLATLGKAAGLIQDDLAGALENIII